MPRDFWSARTGRTLAFAAAFLSVIALFNAPSNAFASTTRQIVIDPATGIALYGYDPVAFFVDRKPRTGKPEFERRWGGVAWRFVNKGNMKAFLDAPNIYCPRYGGYGALSVAKGLTTNGKPVFFALHKGKLYFFYSPANRHIWLENPDTYILKANQNWEKVRHKLSE